MEYNTFKSECNTIAMEIDRLVEARGEYLACLWLSLKMD